MLLCVTKIVFDIEVIILFHVTVFPSSITSTTMAGSVTNSDIMSQLNIMADAMATKQDVDELKGLLQKGGATPKVKVEGDFYLLLNSE